MKINANSVNYIINNEGQTEAITVGFQGFNNRENLTTTIALEEGDLDNLTRNEIIEKGRERLVALVVGETG